MLPPKLSASVALILLALTTSSRIVECTHVWHSGPINCYSCDSAEDCAVSTSTLNKCVGNDAQTCLTVFNAAGAVIQRGCSDAVQDQCDVADNSCYECRSQGCNTLQTNTELIDCLVCDAQSDANCIFNVAAITETRQCHQSCITALYPRTSDKNAPSELVRTCLDDLDLDDRESCVDGSAGNCIACTTDKCNNVPLGERSSCYSCSGDDCEDDPKVTTCRAVVEQEQCFIESDEFNSIVKMGCASEYDAEDVEQLLRNKRLWLCQGDNCNTYSAMPQPHTCSICSSRTDPSCATTPALIPTDTHCSSLTNTDCYVRLLENGHTERGCITNLDGDDYYNCLIGANTTTCTTCTGDKCNINLHPVDRLSCHVCSSEDSATCETSPDANQVCLLYTAAEQCVSTIDINGFTVRGCSSEVTCDAGNGQTCQICEGSNCNTDNLKRKSDGKPGQWQELPLKCLSCSSASDCASSAGSIDVCSEQEYCVTVFDDSGALTARGCSSAIEKTFGSYCDANLGNCFNCNSNECNAATLLSDYIECFYCDSLTNPECARNPTSIVTRRKCNGKCMTALHKRANSSVYDLVRSCLDDKDEADRLICSSGSDTECVACASDACNTVQLPETRLSCYTCTDDCESFDVAECANYNPNDKCYIQYDDKVDIKAMGCYSDLSEEFIQENIHLLYTCEGDNCNSFDNQPEPNKCVDCNSKDNTDCAVDPEKIGSVDECSVRPHTSCMTRLLSDGSIQRGCLTSLDTKDMKACLLGTGNCATCNGVLCNEEIYPADRRRCYRCNTENEASCGSSPATSSACPRYVENDGCSVKVVEGHTYRGCQSEFACDDADKQHCRVCTGADNCNIVDLVDSDIGYPGKWQTPPINCYTCLDDECEAGNLGSLQKCQGNIQQNCATVFDSNNVVVQRGCSDMIYSGVYGQYCDEHSSNCKFCKSTGCNNAKELSVYVDCLLCDGAENGDCVVNTDSITRKISCQNACFTGLYPRNSSDDTSALELARGCLDDLEYEDRELCSTGNKDHCKSCIGALCNEDAVPESRLSCNYCDDEACTKLTSHICSAYRENDQCYIHVGDMKIESMGCASDLETSFLSSNKRDLLLCSGDNCNVRESLNEDGIDCFICNSTSNPLCVSSPSSGIGARCQHYIYPECYTHINPDGVLYRGCLMDTDDDLFEDCTTGSSSTCELCESNKCNVEIYPPDRHSCLRCDSATDADCEKNPSSYASYCNLYDPDDACVSKLENTRTLRGCKSELACDPNSNNCRICTENNCNSVDLLSDFVGEPGKWQTLPLNCLVCDSEEECASGSSLKKCQDNNKQVCVTVFGENDKVQRRGCSDSVELSHADYCENHSDKCFKCKSTGCNDALDIADYIDCYFCDADEDPSCAFETPTRSRKCQKHCVSALYPRSSAEDTAYIATHTCLDDLEFDAREECIGGTKDYCKACDSPLCNSEAVIKDPHECFTCETADCQDQVSIKCSAYRPNDQCYVAFDTYNVVAMGCVSEFETQVVAELVQQKKMYLCDGKNCNSLDLIPNPNTCTICDSESDPRCATNPNTIFETNVCSHFGYPECVAYIDEDGFTNRGCLASLEGSAFYACLTGSDNLCEVCTGDKCNGLNVIPNNRLKCHQCDSTSDPNCSSSPSSNSYCPVYVDSDTCVTTQRGDVIIRGCSSSVHCDDETDTRTCRICNSGDGCNTVDLSKVNAEGSPGIWQDVPISCYVCSNEEDCATGKTIRSCLGNKYQNCMTVFNGDGKVIQRGCTDSVLSDQEVYCDANDGKCPRCNSNGCNVATTLEDYVECLVCDSQNDANCVHDVTAITNTRQCYKHCLTSLLPLFKEENDSYGVVRSCYDDKDEEDRELCEAGDDKNCVVCSDPKCNIVDVVEQRLSCNICPGGDCQNPTPQICPTYREGDQCYIEFDEQRSTVGFGCLSQYSHADEYNLLKSKRLWLCNGNDCNTHDALPSAQTCTICSSRTEVSCATNPSSIQSQTTCASAGIPECYARVLDDGSTERGCLASLHEDEFLSCYNGTSTSCIACQDDNCNKDIYPTNRRSCHICDSQNDASCESGPNNLSICPLYDEDDVCVTNYRNGITYRGCGTSLSCDENDSRSCVKCSEDGCNNVNLASKYDDNFGKWQDLPLTCLTCSDDACDSAETTTSETCQNNNEQDCLTVFNADGKVVRRGCADAVETDYGSYCASNSANCLNCKSNQCNTAVAKSEYVECIYCDSFKDIECLWNPESSSHRRRQCQGGCMSALYPAYDSEDAALDIIRTCLNDKEAEDQATCSAGKDDNCVACTDDKCNVANIPATRLTCYTCEGTECESPESKPCAQYKEDDRCFTRVDESNSVSQLGCLSIFRNQDLASIIKTKRIAICEGADCNLLELPTPTRCAVCDSKDDPLCAVNAEAIGTIETCAQMPYTHCVTKLESDGTTTRGCLYDIQQDDFAACVLGTNENCTICAEDGCNRKLFPADRQQCYTCTSEDDPKCESLPTFALPCPIISDTETCISTLSPSNVTQRGCSSDLQCDQSDYKNCRSCQGTECNGIDLLNRYINDDDLHGVWQDLPLKCHSCSGDQCQNSLGPAYYCTRNDEQDCKTVFNADGSVRRRGCVEDVDDYEDKYCRENEELCFTCKSNECNNAWSLSDYVECAFCSSATDPLCVTNPATTSFQKRLCQGECMVALNGTELIRSCLNDKEEYDRNDCTDDENSEDCSKCNGASCNTFVYPSDRLRCHVCTGAACKATTLEYCHLYDKNDFCFAKYENYEIEQLGCGSSQNSNDIEDWKANNKLYQCYGNDCNSLEKVPSNDLCVSCNSNKTLECAQNANAVTTTVTCFAQCVTRVDTAGHTIRGCFSSLSEAEQSSCITAGTCAACTGEKCNKEIFPANRRKCHICDSKQDTTCEKDPNALTVCPIYNDNDTCVAKNTFGLIERGCGTEMTCDDSDSRICQICANDGCNINRLPGGAAFLRSSLFLTLILAILTTFGFKC